MNKGCLVMVVALLALAAAVGALAQQYRIGNLPGRGIVITAVEFDRVQIVQCEVYYWSPLDPNEDALMEQCRELPYDPCDSGAGQIELIRFVLSGGTCEEPERPDCDGFSPRPPGCP